MKLILLPGYDKSRNSLWLEELNQILTSNQYLTTPFIYQHWEKQEEGDFIKIDEEAKALADSLTKEKEYAIVAKSVGSIVALRAIFEFKITPKFLVFIGTAVRWAKNFDYDIDSWMQEHDLPTLFIHNSKDPVISVKDLRDYLKLMNVQNHEFVELEGRDHNYAEYDQFCPLVKKYVSKRL